MRLTNPQAGSKHILEARRFGAGGSRFFNDKGVLNASSNIDALKNLDAIIGEVASGRAHMRNSEEARIELAAANEYFLAALNAGGNSWMEVAGQIGAAVYQVGNREGVSRNYLVKATLEQGQEPRTRLKVKDVTAAWFNQDAEIQAQFIAGTSIRPDEFQIKGNVIVPFSEVWINTADLTDEAYQKGFEQITVEEDRHYKMLLDNVAGLDNPVHVLASGLTPASLSSLRNEFDTWGLPIGGLWMAADFIKDMTSNASAWVGMYDPVTQYEIIETGFLGRILGMPIRSEPFREEKLRVLNRGQLYLVSTPEYHGSMTDRGSVVVSNYDPAPRGIMGRGFFIGEQVSQAIANSRSVVKGVRP